VSSERPAFLVTSLGEHVLLLQRGDDCVHILAAILVAETKSGRKRIFARAIPVSQETMRPVQPCISDSSGRGIEDHCRPCFEYIEAGEACLDGLAVEQYDAICLVVGRRRSV